MRLLAVLFAFTMLAGCGAHHAHHRARHHASHAPVELARPHATVKHYGTLRFTLTGPPAIGTTLFASTGTWANVPTSYAYRWQHCDSVGANCVDITGATGSSYLVVSADSGFSLRVVVTATNQIGSASAPSAATQVVAGAPVNTALPTVSGSTVQGQTLTTTNGTWTGSPTSFTYRWQDCDSAGNNCTTITGAASSTYNLQASDVGSTIRAAVTAINASGSSSPATSGQTAVVTAATGVPTVTTAPAVTGTPQTASTYSMPNGATFNKPAGQLSVTTGVWSGCGTGCAFTYQWQDCNSSGASCANTTNSGTTGNTNDPCNPTFWCYVVSTPEATNSNTIRAAVTATANGGAGTSSTTFTAVTAQAATNIPVPCARAFAAGRDGLSDANAQSCWGKHTGVTNSSGCTETQVLAATGVSAGTPECDSSRFQHLSGDQTLNTANSVYANKWVDGCLNVLASNITIRNVVVHTQNHCDGCNEPGFIGAIGDGSGCITNFLLEDVMIDGMSPAGGGAQRDIGASNYVCLRCNAIGEINSYAAEHDAAVIDSYGHDLSNNSVGSHGEAVYMDTAQNVSIEHSWMSTIGRSEASGVTGGISFLGSGGGSSLERINNSYLEGAIGVDYTGDDCNTTHDVTISNNVFSDFEGTRAGGGTSYWPNVTVGWVGNGSDANMVWTGNQTELHADGSLAAIGNPGGGTASHPQCP